MSGTFPTSIKPRNYQLQDNRPTLVNASLSGRRSVRTIGAQYYTMTVALPPLDKDDAMDVFSFLQKQKNSYEEFSYQYPITNRGAGAANSGRTVNGAHSAGDNTIAIQGFSASQTDALKAGDLLEFADHDKVYMVESDVDSDASGEMTITISPPLVSSLTDNEAIDCNQPNFKVFLVGDILYTTDASGFFNISFELREVVG